MPSNKILRCCNKLIILTGLLVLVGCASPYEAKWTAAATQPAPADDITGRWQGTWASNANTHSGSLRCIITKTGPDDYLADYHATYWDMFKFAYSMTLHARRRQGQTVYFDGAANLGWMAGGEYTYSGRCTPAEFFADYQSSSDEGHFEMKRLDEKK